MSTIEPTSPSNHSFGSTDQTRLLVTARNGRSFSAMVYETINLITDPDRIDDLVAGRLFEVQDPEGGTYTLAFPIICHAPDRQLMVLFLPESLRHTEFTHRTRLLESLARLPEVETYMRNFKVAFGTDELQALLQTSQDPASHDAATIPPIPEPPSNQRPEVDPAEVLALKNEVQDLQERLRNSEERQEAETRARDEALARREAELRKKEDDLRHEEARIKELDYSVTGNQIASEAIQRQLALERTELDALRTQLTEERRRIQVLELNLEQEKLRLQQATPDVLDEATQVVTDDQFLEVVQEDTVVRPPAPANLGPSESNAIPTLFFEVADADETSFALLRNRQLVVGYLLEDHRAASFVEQEGNFVFQLHRIDDVPVASLTFLALDADEQPVDAVCVPLHTAHPSDAALLKELESGIEVHTAIYEQSGDLITAWEAPRPFKENVAWARRQMQNWELHTGPDAPSAAADAAQSLRDESIELWGTMRHPFHHNSFQDLDNAADVQLATGIVEYWSQPDQIAYLIGKRAFPMPLFLEIQKRVVREALHWGIAPGDELCRVAITSSIIPDLRSLTQRLLANFTEVCVGVRPNNLDALEQWENWDALIALAKDQNVTMDPSMVELAEISLKRAEEEGPLDDDVDADEADELHPADLIESVELPPQVVARQSSSSGITYFVANEHGPDTFEEHTRLKKEDLLKLLDDDNARYEAAQLIVKRYGAQTLAKVMSASEKLNPAQLEALIRFVEAHAEGLEAALIKNIDNAGPAGTYLVARALSGLGTTAALPRLLTALRDDRRRGTDHRLTQALAQYKEKLLPSLTRELKKSPEDPHLLGLLVELNHLVPGAIADLKRDGNKALQRAAVRAEEM